MKIRKRKMFLAVGLVMLVLAACSNVDGDLDAKWQLRQYQYADGSMKRQDSIFYNFQKGSFSAICLLKNGSYQTFFGNYSLKGDKISIILLPESMDDENYAFYIGWENGERTFTMEELISSSLCLECGGTRYLFRKY
ncbi:lipocalin-like domain-containing protein [uncultured Bacteroides sp.]|uniref:lipocalin-like domain-containing protein n=1 Tax=uncultured Bacteroides sp. TaxID=162156 RepID=UPI0025977B06|nr:lipocalin-like domain-containing protein [uncultured Bacteroides sp.]